jgi:hypothetical protein
MRAIVAICLLILCALSRTAIAGSDGYIEWSEVAFTSGHYRIHIRVPETDSGVAIVEIVKNGVAIELPPLATASLHNLWLNDAELVYLCCGNKVKLQIPVLEFDKTGQSTKRTWEIFISEGKFERAAYAEPDPSDEF